MQLRVCIRKILWGTFNQLPREQIENSRDFPREQIHHTTPSSFQQIVPYLREALAEAGVDVVGERPVGLDAVPLDRGYTNDSKSKKWGERGGTWQVSPLEVASWQVMHSMVLPGAAPTS